MATVVGFPAIALVKMLYRLSAITFMTNTDKGIINTNHWVIDTIKSELPAVIMQNLTASP